MNISSESLLAKALIRSKESSSFSLESQGDINEQITAQTARCTVLSVAIASFYWVPEIDFLLVEGTQYLHRRHIPKQILFNLVVCFYCLILGIFSDASAALTGRIMNTELKRC